MKKLLSILALALCFVACQNEPNIGAKNSDLANVVLNIEAPELATRADADANAGKNSAFGAIDFFNDADWDNFDVRYILEVYDVNDNGTGEPIYRERLVKCLDKYAQTTFNLRLVPNREYKFVVFADFVEEGSEDDLYYDTTDLNNITAKTNAEGWNAMNEVRDAYFVSENVEVKASLDKTLTLKRPFGKVRVIATDLDYIAGYSTPGYVEVTYHTEALYKSFNAVNGNLNDAKLAGNELTYSYEVKKDAPYTEGYDANAAQQTLFADYLFAREGQQMPINFTMSVYESKGGRLIKTTNFDTQIPVQRNHLTTIIGDVLTTEANITIVVNDDFMGELDGNASMESVAAPAVTATVEGNTVTLKWEAVEGAAKYFVRNANTETSFEETTELTKVYENLEWETEYTFEVYATSEKGLVSETTVAKATTDKKPAVPALATPVVKSDVKGNIVTLTWDEIEGAAYYTVQVNDAEEELVNDPTYEFTGDYETEYTFTVKAISADVEVNLDSEAAVVKATTEANVPGEFQPEVSEWGVVGDLTSWGNDIVMYTTPTENLFVAEKVEINSGAFKIRANKEWNDAKNYGFEVAGKAYADKYYAVITGSGSQNMTPMEYGVYDIYFDLAQQRVAIMTPGKAYAEAEDGGAPIVVIEGLKEHEWGLVGSFNNWDVANYVVTVVEGDWAVAKGVALDNGAEFKFAADKSWTLSYGTACDVNVGETYQAKNNAGNMKFVGEAGNYDLYFSLVSAKFYMTGAGAEAPAEPVALATPEVKAEVEGNTVTLTWEAVENAAQYGITVGTEMPVFVEETTYDFTGEYETEYTFNVVAVPADETNFAASEAAVVTATTEAEPVVEEKILTVAEFIALTDIVPQDATAEEIAAAPMYTLKGTITAVANSSYGNFDLTDETGTVLIYGLMSPDGATNKYWATSGAKLGDEITVKTIRTEYNNAPQGKNAWYVEHSTPGSIAFWVFDATAASFTAAGGEKEIALNVYNTTSEVNIASDNAQFSAAYSAGVLTVTAQENTATEAISGNITVTCGSLSQVVAVSQAAASGSDGDEKTEVTGELKFIADNRTSFTTSQQVWEANNIKLVNDKGSSTSNVADYVNPARFYKSSKITVSAPGEITTIVFDCNNNSYATALKDSIKTGTVSVSSDKVTVVLDGSSNEFVISSLTGGQVRMDSMTVTYLE